MLTPSTKVTAPCLGAVCVLSAAAARADTYTLDATDSGFVTVMGGSAKGDGTLASGAKYNYSVGRELHYADGSLGAPLLAMDRKNYFVFNLAGVTGTITTASVRVYTGVYESVDPSEVFRLRQVDDQVGALADADALGAPGLIPGDFDDPSDPLVGMAAALYTKIPMGGPPGPPLHGLTTVTSSLDGTFIDIAFTPAGLVFLNDHIGMRILLGGECPTAIPAPGHPPPDSPQQPFGFTGAEPGTALSPDLVLETVVPAPGAGALVLLCGAGAAGRRRR